SWDPKKNALVHKPEFVWSYRAPGTPANTPVCFIAMEDAEAFCKWLSKKEGRTYLVPTEEQWEFAGRAGTTTLWWTGDDAETLKLHEVVKQNGARPVGSKSANPFGLFDMHGNVREYAQTSKGATQCAASAFHPLGWSHSAFRESQNLPPNINTGFRV